MGCLHGLPSERVDPRAAETAKLRAEVEMFKHELDLTTHDLEASRKSNAAGREKLKATELQVKAYEKLLGDIDGHWDVTADFIVKKFRQSKDVTFSPSKLEIHNVNPAPPPHSHGPESHCDMACMEEDACTCQGFKVDTHCPVHSR